MIGTNWKASSLRRNHTPPLAAELEELAPNAAAAEIAFAMLAEAGQIDNVTAAEHVGQFEMWAKGVDYRLGAIRIYDGVLYNRTRRKPDGSRWKRHRYG